MIKIRLLRTGKKNQPSYRLVVTPARSKRNGRYLQSLGFYQPSNKTLKINLVEYQNWRQKGAQPTPTVLRLVKKYREKTS